MNYQDIVRNLPLEQQEDLQEFTNVLFDTLLENEISYTRDVYDKVDLTMDVVDFLKYNANKALNNLGYEARYEHDSVNPIVMNGINTGTKTHDFFSTKGNGYKKAKVVALNDSDFIFE